MRAAAAARRRRPACTAMSAAVGLLVVLLCAGPLGGLAEPDEQPDLPAAEDGVTAPGLSELFQSMDRDGDGQIGQQEAIAYIGSEIGGTEFDTAQELTDAAQQMLGAVDGGDTGTTVSVTELESHLHSVLQVRAPPEGNGGRRGRPCTQAKGGLGCRGARGLLWRWGRWGPDGGLHTSPLQ